jgi:hypothetical protein
MRVIPSGRLQVCRLRRLVEAVCDGAAADTFASLRAETRAGFGRGVISHRVGGNTHV